MNAQPTQRQIFYQEHRKVADGNILFMEMVREGTMTKETLNKLIEKRPEVYGRYSNWLTSPHLEGR